MEKIDGKMSRPLLFYSFYSKNSRDVAIFSAGGEDEEDMMIFKKCKICFLDTYSVLNSFCMHCTA